MVSSWTLAPLPLTSGSAEDEVTILITRRRKTQEVETKKYRTKIKKNLIEVKKKRRKETESKRKEKEKMTKRTKDEGCRQRKMGTEEEKTCLFLCPAIVLSCLHN